MHHALVDLTGKTLENFSDLDEAKQRLREMVEVEPELKDELILLSYSHENGYAGSDLMYEDL